MGVEENGHWQLEREPEVYIQVKGEQRLDGEDLGETVKGVAAPREGLLVKIGQGSFRS